MNKKFFRIALLCALLGTGAAVTSCTDYDQEIADLQESVSALEKKVSDIQAAINAGEVVTSVEKTANGIVVKTNKGSYEINNGKNGAPGTVVTIGENGNWFLDGKDTGVAAKGDKGEQGQNGTNGTNGQDAEVKPEIKDGHLFINGVDCGVIAPKAIVAVVKDDVLTLTNVEGSMEPIVLNLKGGLTALVFRPAAQDNQLTAATLFYKEDTLDIVASAQGTATFKVFPADFDVKNAKFFFSDSYKSAEASVEYVEGSAKLANGILAVNFLADTASATWNTSLDVELNGTTVSSNYFKVYGDSFYAQANNGSLLWTLKAKRFDETTGKLGFANLPENYSFAYDKVLALADSVVSVTGRMYRAVETVIADALFPVEYTLSLPDSTLVDGTKTAVNTEDVLAIVDNKVVVNSEKWNGTTAVGREKLYVTITSTVNGVKLAESTVKVNVTAKPAGVTTIVLDKFELDYAKFLAEGVTSTTHFTSNVPFSEILKQVDGGISADEFNANYGENYTYDGSLKTGTTISKVKKNPNSGVIDSLRLGINWRVDENKANADTIVFKSKDNTRNVVIVFPYSVTFDETFFPAFDENLVHDGVIYENTELLNKDMINKVSLENVLTSHVNRVTWYVPNMTNGILNTFKSDEDGNINFGTYPTVAADTTSQNAVISNNKVLAYKGCFTAAKEVITLDAVFNLPNTHKFYHPQALKASFDNHFTFSKPADVTLDPKEDSTATLKLSNMLSIKYLQDIVYSSGKFSENNTNTAEADAAEDRIKTAKSTIANLEATYPDYRQWAIDTANFVKDTIKYQGEINVLLAEKQENVDSIAYYRNLKISHSTPNQFTQAERDHNAQMDANIERLTVRNQVIDKLTNKGAFVGEPKYPGQFFRAAADSLADRKGETKMTQLYGGLALMAAFDAWDAELKSAQAALAAATSVSTVDWKEGFTGTVFYYILKSDVENLAKYGVISGVTGSDTWTDPETKEVYYKISPSSEVRFTAQADKVRSEISFSVWVDAHVEKTSTNTNTTPVVGADLEQEFKVTVKATK